MKAFIFDESSGGLISEIVERASIEIVSPEFLLGEQQVSGRSLIGGSHFESLSKIDFLVLEITQANPEVNFLLAQSILQQKPTLCLYKKNREPRDLLNYLITKGTPKCISTHAYSSGSLSNVVDRFISLITELPREVGEVPSIKFTLRLTPRADRYLDWKSKKMNRTKADFLRDWLRVRMDEDEEFQNKTNR